jgi:hypothetical protein
MNLLHRCHACVCCFPTSSINSRRLMQQRPVVCYHRYSALQPIGSACVVNNLREILRMKRKNRTRGEQSQNAQSLLMVVTRVNHKAVVGFLQRRIANSAAERRIAIPRRLKTLLRFSRVWALFFCHAINATYGSYRFLAGFV